MPDGRIATNAVELNPVFLIYAFRYALGRMTYAVSDVGDALIANRDALTPDWRQQIVQDINNAIAGGYAGHACDIERWREVAKAMAG